MSDPQRPAADAATPLLPTDLAQRLVDPASYGNPGDLHEMFGWTRANQPVSRVVLPNFDPFWLVSSYHDIQDVERRAETFHSGDLSTVLLPADMRAAIEAHMGSPHLTRSLVNMDGQEHRIYRGLTQSWFQPASLKRLSDRIRGIARVHIQRMLDRGGTCDFVSDVALRFPLHVIMEILGVPEEDEPRMLVLTQQLFGARDPELGRAAATMADAQQGLRTLQAVLGDFNAYFERISEDRRANPRDDLATVIATAQVDGKPISEHEANSYYVIVATAGHDTTSASTAGGVLALAERPELLRQLHEDPALVPKLVDEAIRWITPVRHFMRSATVDTEIGGRAIAAGDWILLSYMSANRDAAAFDKPDEFRLDRPLNRQLAFGYGPHLCLGQHLAKLEMRIFFEELLASVGTIELAGEPAWTQSNFVGGPKRLPIRFTQR